MPFNAVPRNDFVNREDELAYLRRLADFNDDSVTGNVLLKGPRGIGKTELLKLVYHTLFWEQDGPLPFYYRFRRATLKGAHFSRDYFSRFIRQFIAYVSGDLSLVFNMSTPLQKLVSAAPPSAFSCLSELLADFNEQAVQDGLPGQVLAAISAPLTLANCAGRNLVIMLDDFQLAREVYESVPGDTPGVVSIFEDSMKSPRCPHILTGSPQEALEAIFGDDSLRGSAERLSMGPLPRDAAFGLFRETCIRHGASEVREECGPLMKYLCGNPLYITNLARAICRAGSRDITAQGFMESYCREVFEGETASYWSSVLKADIRDARLRKLALDVLVRRMESPRGLPSSADMPRLLGVPEKDAGPVMDALEATGMMPATGGLMHDTVLEDYIRGAHLAGSAVEGARAVHESIRKRRFGREAAPLGFEMVIPKSSDAELVAAKALEQICAGVDLDKDEVQRLLLALIEACINAMEHSRGYDDRVFMKCSVYPERLEVSVESQGRTVDPEALLKSSEDMPGLDQKRGRGFSLMSRFVDDIRVERAGDRTKVVLVKAIKPVKETK